MEQVLLLNATYEPLRIISWKRAIILMVLDKVEVLETYDQEIHTATVSFRLPAVVRLFKFIRFNQNTVRFSRQNIYMRDRYRCQYCGKRFTPEQLTYDHVIPRSKGGRTNWENIVTCCLECNKKKGGRTPEQAGMKLLRKPKKPSWHPVVMVSISKKNPPQPWQNYLIY